MVKRIRETDGETPILFSSALISPKDVVKGYEIGANNYIKKPFIPEELDAHVPVSYTHLTTVSGWNLVNAGREDKGYITSACFLQGRRCV